MNKPACRIKNIKDYLLLFGIGLGVLYWIIESIIHTLVFHNGTLLEQIFTPNLYDIGLRLLVLCIFILLSAHAQFMIKKCRRVENGLRAEQQRLFSILDNLPACVHIQARDYSIRFANRIFRERFGAPEGKKCYEVLVKRKEPCEECPTFRAFETKSPQFNVVTPNNGRVYEVYDYPLTDDNGSPLLLELSIDITERRQAEEAIRTSEMKLRTLFEEALNPIMVVDESGRYIDANSAALKFLECTKEELLGKEDLPGKSVWDFSPPHLSEQQKKEHTPFMARRTIEVDYLVRGRIKTLLLNSIPLTISGQSVLYGIGQDITERKKVEGALRESEEKFRLVTETVQDVFWMNTPGLKETIYVSPAYEKIWGRSLDSLYKEPFSFIDAIHPDDREQVLKEIEENPAGRWDFEYRLVRPDGSILWIQDRGFPIWDENGQISKIIGVATDITGRKRAEEELNKYRSHLEQIVQERTEKLTTANSQLQAEIIERNRTKDALDRFTRQNELILDAVGEGIYGVDLWGNTTFVNSSAVKITGYEPDELIGHHQHEILHHSKPDESFYPQEECPIYAAMKDGLIRHTTDEVFWRKDGTSFPVEYVSTPIKEKGTIVGAVVIFKDITERRRMDEELRQSQAQMAEAQKLASVGSWDWDISADRMTWSEECGRILGIAGKGLDLSLEEGLMKYVYPADRHYLRSIFEDARLHKKPFTCQHRIVRPDGSLRIVRGRGGVFSGAASGAGGSPVKIVGFIQDVTEMKKAEDALRESEKKYRQLIENAQEGIWAIDAQSLTTFANPRMAEIVGYTVDEMIGKPVSLFMDEQGAALFSRSFELRKQGIKERHDMEILHKDGSRVYATIDSSPIIDDDGNFVGAIALVLNITERKRAEQEKEKVRAQLLQSQKMEAIGILAGGIAHDFNNLLTTIQGYTSMVMMKLDTSGRLFRDLNQVHLAADRAAGLTRQLLLFSRKQPQMPVSLNLNRTIDSLLKMLQRLIGEDITVSTSLDPSLWPIQADESSIDQVIMNLVLNARDAMPKGGSITIKTESVIMDEEQAACICEARPGQFVCLSIADTGTGMDKEIIDRIFEPFFTTKGLGKGTGLGLSVVYGIVKQHEGWINIYSEHEQGSVFKIYLPASSYKSRIKAEERIPVQEIQGRGERILLVEDEEGVRDLTSRALRENGYVVIEAASTQEALDIFEQEKGNFHLILSDVVLPDQTGLELADQLLRRQPNIQILLVSGYTDQKSEWITIRKKGFRFVQKPYALPDLLRSVRELIEA